MKKFLKYILIFILVLCFLVSLLFLVAMIPKKYIYENIQESLQHYKIQDDIYEVNRKHDYSIIHNEADAFLLNIIYCLNSDSPIKSVLEAKYYESEIKLSSFGLIEAVEQEKEGNTEYLRYWHGSIIVVKLLLLLLNIDEIVIFNGIGLLILLTILLVLLFKKKNWISIISLIIGLILTVSNMVPFCLEYVWTYYIMLIVSIIGVLIEKKGDSKLNLLFFVTGIITAFFDFLSTETLTILVPLILILSIRYQEKRLNNFFETIKFIFFVLLLWFLGYAATFVSKWIVASIVLNKNVFEMVFNQIMLRVNGDVIYLSGFDLCKEAITKNVETLYSVSPIIIMIPIVFALLFMKKKPWFSLILLVLAIIPYIRYFVLANHSYRHYFFTFRAQLATIMAFIMVLYYLIDTERIKKIVKRLYKK